MLRDKNLIPLSHQHQHALALCVRIDRGVEAGKSDPEPWLAEIESLFGQEIGSHFLAEESVLFPAAERFSELAPLVGELRREHDEMRDFFSQAIARKLDGNGVRILGQTLSEHIRKEERQLFEGMQRLMNEEELARLGEALNQQLANSSEACLLPNEATRLKPRNR